MGIAGLQGGSCVIFSLDPGYSACHLGVTVSCPQCRAGSGSESSSQVLTAHHRSGFQLARSADIGRLRSSFLFLCPRGGPFRKLTRHTHTETQGVALPWP